MEERLSQEVNFSGSGPNFSRGRSRYLRVWSRTGAVRGVGSGGLEKGLFNSIP